MFQQRWIVRMLKLSMHAKLSVLMLIEGDIGIIPPPPNVSVST